MWISGPRLWVCGAKGGRPPSLSTISQGHECSLAIAIEQLHLLPVPHENQPLAAGVWLRYRDVNQAIASDFGGECRGLLTEGIPRF